MTDAANSWLLGTGDAATTEPDKRTYRPFRFFLKQGTKKEIVFLTDYPNSPVIYEHTVPLFRRGKKTWSQFTCIKTQRGMTCPLCTYADNFGNYYSRRVRMFSVLDFTPYTDKKGAKHAYSKVILAAPDKVASLLALKYTDMLDSSPARKLRGAKYRVVRSTSDTSPNVGDMYDFIAWTNLDDPKVADSPEKIEAFTDMDWLSVLAPNVEELAKIAAELRAGGVVTGSYSGGDGGVSSDLFGSTSTSVGSVIDYGSSDDEVPFDTDT